MITLSGRCVCKGKARGKLKILKREKRIIEQVCRRDPKAEWQRFLQAKIYVFEKTMDLYEKAVMQVGEEDAQILKFHAVILEDDTVMGPIKQMITNEHFGAEWAVSQSFGIMAEMFKNMSDAYFSARSADVTDVMYDLLDVLSGVDNQSRYMLEEPCILAADDILPSELFKFAYGKVLGVIIAEGSQDSHAAILMRHMGIPSLTDCDALNAEWDGCMAVLDGDDGLLHISEG